MQRNSRTHARRCIIIKSQESRIRNQKKNLFCFFLFIWIFISSFHIRLVSGFLRLTPTPTRTPNPYPYDTTTRRNIYLTLPLITLPVISINRNHHLHTKKGIYTPSFPTLSGVMS